MLEDMAGAVTSSLRYLTESMRSLAHHRVLIEARRGHEVAHASTFVSSRAAMHHRTQKVTALFDDMTVAVGPGATPRAGQVPNRPVASFFTSFEMEG